MKDAGIGKVLFFKGMMMVANVVALQVNVRHLFSKVNRVSFLDRRNVGVWV